MNESQIFTHALKLAAPAERTAYLNTACAGNLQLRSDVEALLLAHNSDPGFLEQPVGSLQNTVGAAQDAADQLPLEAADELVFLTPSDRPGSLGRLGHYEIQEVVGQGGMGIVMRAFDEKLHRMVAIKVMAAQLATNATARKRFTREAQAAAAVTHDHIVTIHAVEEANGLPYLVMQYVSGVSLQQRLDRSGPLELREIVRIGMQTAVGLAAAHAHGLIHRDIKPANILLENGVERVKITDFGLARAVADASLTQSGMVAGTPQYMSPEQARGEAVDQRSDLFSVGSVLYAMCAGRPPFRATTCVAVLKRVCEDTPSPLKEINAEIPAWLAEIVTKLHAKDPADRFQSAAELGELLKGHLARLQDPSVVWQLANLRVDPKAGRQAAPRRRRWALAAAVLLLCVIAGLGFTEATNVTNLRATVIRIFTPEGTLIVEVDDPGVKVTIEGDGGLVITGAGLQEVRLKPGSYKVKAAKDGKPVRLDQELVTITRGDKQVVKVRLEGEAAAAKTAAKGEPGAFVVLTGKDITVHKFDTLAEAVLGASDGDTIEIRGNGPFVTPPIVITVPSLTIRAGEGFRPVLESAPEGLRPGFSLISTKARLVVEHSPNARLVLEGLEFRCLVGDSKGGTGWTSLLYVLRPLHVANCRFLTKNNIHIQTDTGPPVEVRNCEFLCPEAWAIFPNPPKQSGPGVRIPQIAVDNCLLTAGVFAPYRLTSPRDGSIRLTGTTFNTSAGALRFATNIDQGSNFAEADWQIKALRVEASGNLFETSPVLGFGQEDGGKVISPPDDAKGCLARMVGWRGERNLYPVNGALLDVVQPWPMRSANAITGLVDWREFWGTSEADSVEGRIHYQGGDILTKLRVTPEKITPDDFRLRPDSAGYRAGKDGKDLGADVDLVGPGAAYERWKKTPAYQQWLKDTKQTRVDPPKSEQQAFVLLGNKGAFEHKFDTLAEAVLGASDGGTIEVRGNGPFVTPALRVGDKVLSIRAGDGFQPVIQLNQEGIKSGEPLIRVSGVFGSLILEGLEMHRVSSTIGDGESKNNTLLFSDGAPLHVANCRLLQRVDGQGRIVRMSLWTQRCPILQVRNCQFVEHVSSAALKWTPHVEEKGIVKNCLFACAQAVELPFNYSSSGSLTLENNTLATNRNICVRLYKRPALGTPEDKTKLLHFEARENILGGDFNLWEHPDSLEKNTPMSVQEGENLLQHVTHWKEACNLYGIAPGKPFLTLIAPNGAYKKTTRPYSTLAEWQDFWGLEALDSLQGVPVFQGGDLLARARQDPEKLMPEDFRLAPGSPGKGAGKDGKDLGADVDLVGPGAAYERWKKTPDYQQWLNDTGHAKK